ncbi:hypothetical protein N7507_001266 [Penicillium longicatenatum]|nr:hypothetical protein N7507_001266 [Penicillium longicatenatum]
MLSWPFIVVSLLSVQIQALDTTNHYNIAVPKTTPEDAEAVPANFFGFGLESGLLSHYDNAFSENIVNAIAARMSAPLVIRVGGSSGDKITYNESLTEPYICNVPVCDSTSTYTIGPSYFNVMKRLQNASMTIQAPMNTASMNNSMTFLRLAWNALGQDRVEAIALGNEPNYYPNDLPSWTAAEYVNKGLAIEDEFIREFQLEGNDTRIFQIGEIASEVIQGIFPLFTMEDVLNDPTALNGRNKYASDHLYQMDIIGEQPGANYYTTDVLQWQVMAHNRTSQVLEGYARDAAWMRSKNLSFPLVISEIGSAIGNSPPDFAGGFGAGLWAVDIHLKAMSIGIKQITNTQEPTATHGFWVPDNSGPQTTGPAVQGQFPAAAFITDFVGKDGSLGKIHQLLGDPLLTAYAMYDLKTEHASRIAVVNLKEWHYDANATDNIRGNTTVTLNVGSETRSVLVQRMRSDYGAYALGFDNGGPEQNTSWAGEQWSYRVDGGKGHFLHGPQSETLQVTNGTVKVVIPDTEAVMVSLQRHVAPVSVSACPRV